MSLDTLPTELLLIIFSNFTSESDRQSLRNSNRHLRSLFPPPSFNNDSDAPNLKYSIGYSSISIPQYRQATWIHKEVQAEYVQRLYRDLPWWKREALIACRRCVGVKRVTVVECEWIPREHCAGCGLFSRRALYAD